ncbi:DNA repair protein RecN [Pelistega europaea]|uniref:DNA repair protein RecN n=1 Tax=Pelistega europaea TaxID=106147 RepID=A0A7Y4L9R4_9BURK|nr:DNA repair protein RecN [Pelistega europaea]NOL49562.1 DNA repair protein RecN [Pelistega europaea]
MLLSLHIRNFVIVAQSDIYFEAGFTVFSGETGAGKSILIDALSLTLGQRSEPHFIREGADKADISAIFSPSAAAQQWLEAQDIEIADELILRRTIDRQGKSKAFINGTPATLTQLREIAELLVDIHGQHAHQQLLKTSAQRAMLDAHGNHQSLVKSVQIQWKAWQKALDALQQANMNKEQQQALQERLNWQLQELQQLKPGKNEWAEIDSEYTRLAHASSLLEGASQTLNELDNDQQSLCTMLAHASARIAQLMNKDDRLKTIYESLESARIACVEAASDLSSYLDRVDLDPQRLEQTEQRMRAMFDMAKKFRIEPEELYNKQQELSQELATLNQSVDVEALQLAVNQAKEDYMNSAKSLSQARAKTAQTLSKAVTESMQTLAMQGGQFEIELQACEPSAQGLETVQFNVAGHAGATPRALAKVASGGELARISLALSVMANKAHQVPTLIFDEVDTGIGGAVAEVVGKLLRQLGDSHQVLCVTHLPQVAACGHHHFEVCKVQENGETLSHITVLDYTARVEEIARMLGGIQITTTSREHADEMLKNAGNNAAN